MSSLFDKHKNPLVIDHPLGGRRLVAEIFPHKEGGILFFDTFWPGASWHPTHHVPGEITGEGPWRVGDSTLFLLDEKNPGHKSLWVEYFAWRQGQIEHDDFRNTVNNREFVRQLAREMGAQV